MYDVIVVGARVAGASTALLLARSGYRVLLLERSAFPKDTLSTLYIHQPGVALLGRWGVLDAVTASGCPPLDRVTYQVADVRLEGCSRPVDGRRAAYAPRRTLLDPLLVQAAVAAGAEYREGCAVEELLFDGERVTGVRCRSARSGAQQEHASLVVGADGMRSLVADRVRAATLIEDPELTCAYYTYWEGVSEHFELFEAPGRWVGAIPTHDGATLIGAYFPQSEFARVRADALSAYLDAVRTTAPGLADRLPGLRPLERLHGTGTQRNFFRRASGPGWALVGDAAHHKDSITARGITDAFRQAQSLADAIGSELHSPVRLAAALDEYAAGQKELLIDDYHSTLTVAALEIHEDRLAMLRAVATSEDLRERYFSSVAGVSPVEELYTPELLELLYG
ncbi:NAD(P)/FAD-dependent oxidoreductase [Streptomyces sp. NPDC020681]|uniref:NAD(P)/FAD-dependent oxidoreductase n=1 Tax=Streptomyces sp. NPDC020681 TaxID=3365083 RepID=UPI0037982E2C